jgi:undecaprenyl-diphosphatase
MYKKILLASSAVVVSLWATMSTDLITNIDNTVDVIFYNLNTPVLDNFFIIITSLFNKEYFLIWLLLLLGILLWRKRLTYASFLFLGVFAGQSVKAVLKDFTDKARPGNPFGIDIHGSSFPSGHATTSTFIFLTLSILLIPLLPKKYQLPAQILSISGLILVPLSRVWLHVHYLSDILAGVALGIATFAAIKILFTYLIRILHNAKLSNLPPLLKYIDKRR